jgi:hypothetical protein
MGGGALRVKVLGRHHSAWPECFEIIIKVIFMVTKKSVLSRRRYVYWVVG